MKYITWFNKFAAAPITLFVVGWTAFGIGTTYGYREGDQHGVDGVMCVMDRLGNSNGARGRSAWCQRIDSDRDARK